jgi:hypothetical protein
MRAILEIKVIVQLLIGQGFAGSTRRAGDRDEVAAVPREERTRGSMGMYWG